MHLRVLAIFAALIALPANARVIDCTTQTGCSDRPSLAAGASRGREGHFRHRQKARADLTVLVASSAIDQRPDPRPHAWCAWWLRRHLGIPRSAFPADSYNLARAFAKIGSPAPRGCTGCIAVFSRGHGGHVGLVESWDSRGDPVILSGNFNGRIDTAPHPASRLIALRWASR